MATEKWILTLDTGTLECSRDLAQGSGCVAGIKAFVLSLLFLSVSQSHALSKIGGECGQRQAKHNSNSSSSLLGWAWLLSPKSQEGCTWLLLDWQVRRESGEWLSSELVFLCIRYPWESRSKGVSSESEHQASSHMFAGWLPDKLCQHVDSQASTSSLDAVQDWVKHVWDFYPFRTCV